MNAVDVIKDLIRLGTIVADAAEKNKKDDKFDYVEFLNGTAPDEIAKVAKQIWDDLSPDKLGAAVDVVEKKQQDLLSGRKLQELDTDELVKYSALTDTKLLLKTAILKRSAESDFYVWLIDGGGLASVIQISRIGLTLLV